MIDRYAVIGNPVAHSKSPRIHARFAALTGQDMAYTAVLSPLEGFEQTVRAFVAEGGLGANVTLPFKEQAYRLCTSLSARARSAGAVNTLVFKVDGIHGDNTDGCGLVRDLTVNLGCGLRDRRVLLMGAGGAARGVVLPLIECGPARLTIANRTADKAVQLAQAAAAQGQGIDGCGYAELDGRSYDVVINATSAGLQDALPPLPAGLFAPGALAYDMLYGRETLFMQFAAAQGAKRVADGLGMLVEQAAESFTLWRGVRPDTGPVMAELRAG